ncbi:hypothetical protein [Nocardia brasiliensis]|uniref:hypothetical protein n=1 Tax=Nocardia brasiliensis TaxID=37326 RepID=UPI002453B554|nr:hypothetical protein [Nocardia brasiliensis]
MLLLVVGQVFGFVGLVCVFEVFVDVSAGAFVFVGVVVGADVGVGSWWADLGGVVAVG